MSDVITPIVADTDESSHGESQQYKVTSSEHNGSSSTESQPISPKENRRLLLGGIPEERTGNPDEIVELGENNGLFDGRTKPRPVPIRKTQSGASSSKASTKPSLLDNPKISTIRQHYYPEGGWGWVICACGFVINMLTNGILLSFGILHREIVKEFGEEKSVEAMWLGSMALSTGLFVSPLIVAFCRRKSTRLTAVFGGLTSALGCLFTSFASQLHQVFFSYGFLMALGLGLARETCSLMLGQYFKRRRETVEVFVQSGTGVGIVLFSYVFSHIIRSLGWRLGLHAVTGIAVIPFFVGIFYRSASLYHPQRRAILHLKNQRKKIKDKSGVSDKPPFFDFSALNSGTLVVTMASAGLCSFGLYAPFFHFVHVVESEKIEEESILMLQLFHGSAFSLGCLFFGAMVVRRSAECMIAKHYLCQAAMVGSGLSHIALCGLQGYHGYVIFVWLNGVLCGGLHYAIKVLVLENIRAKCFGRAWAYVEWSQSIPVLVGIPVTGYISRSHGDRTGFYFSAACCFVGAISMTCMNAYRYSYNTSRSGQGSCSTCTSQTPSELRTQESIDTGVCTCLNNSLHSNNSVKNQTHPKCQKTISFASTVNIADDEARRTELLTSEDGPPEYKFGNHWRENEQCIVPGKTLGVFLPHEDFANHQNDDCGSGRLDECTCFPNKDAEIVPTNKRPITVIEEVTSVV